MIKKWGVTLLGVVTIIAILLFALQQIFIKTTLSEQEIINRVESLYNGSVEDITKNTRHYNVVFSDGTKVYEVLVDEEQGTFRDLTLLTDRGNAIIVKNESNESVAADNTDVSSNTEALEPASPSVRITESAVTEIVLKQFKGEVEDIQFYTAADGGYYIVELETEEQEAAFQIHAITGKILSVVYEE